MSNDKYISLEGFLLNYIEKVSSIKDITPSSFPKIYFISDIRHAIVIFPNNTIFNCNPRDYPLYEKENVTKDQVEPSIEEYEEYWNNVDDEKTIIIENEQNCILWSTYYLWWYIYKKDEKKPFSFTLFDLEKWIEDIEVKNLIKLFKSTEI